MIANRRKVLSFAAASMASLATGVMKPVVAQANATRLFVGFQPGGGFDFIARAFGEHLKTQLSGLVLVENKPGVGGKLAVDTIRRAQPDGQSLLVSPSSVLTLFPHTARVPTYDPVKDLATIARLASFDYGFAVSTTTNITSLKQYIEVVKKNKELGAYGSPGAGLSPHFVGMMLARATGLDLLHVPYKGTAPAIQDVMGNQIPAVCATAPALVAGHKNGRLRVLATTGMKRNPDLADVPTFAEAGIKDLVLEEWAGLFAPASTPKEIVEKLSKATFHVLADAKLQAQFKTQGFYTAPLAPEEATRLIKTEYDNWKKVVSAIGFKESE